MATRALKRFTRLGATGLRAFSTAGQTICEAQITCKAAVAWEAGKSLEVLDLEFYKTQIFIQTRDVDLHLPRAAVGARHPVALSVLGSADRGRLAAARQRRPRRDRVVY